MRKGLLAASLAGALGLGAAAQADVTVERTVRSSVIQGLGGTEGTTTEKISGLRKRDISSTKLSGGLGGFLGKLGGPQGSDTITDIENDVVWKLDHKNKTYTETRISAAMDDLRKQESGEPAGKDEPAEDRSSEVRIVRNEVTVKETGEKKTINGFDCSRYVITWLLETENVKTKERATTQMVTDLWNTPEIKETRALATEEAAFAEAYLKKLGLEPSAAETKKFGLAAVGALFGGDATSRDEGLKKVQAELAKIQGFAIATNVRWESGPGAGTRPDAKAAPAQDPPAAGGMGGLLSGFAKKMMKGGGEAPAEQPKPSASSALFESYSEIRKIEVADLPAAEFQVPAGYQKQ